MTAFFKSIRNNKLAISIRKLFPNDLINITWHLPKAILANFIYLFPGKKIKVIAVTGTKGKTSTAHLIYHILKSNQRKVGLISTIEAIIADKSYDTGLHVTNPSPFALQKFLHQAVKEQLEYVVLEVTSHGLAQFRNWGLPFELGVFTNIQSDHLEYHHDLNEYKRIKAKLIDQSKKVLINQQDPGSHFLLSVASKKNVPTFQYSAEKTDFASQNKQAAIQAAVILGIDQKSAQQACLSFPGVSGRMEIIQKQPFLLVIDFAHTPDSLELALKELKKSVKIGGRLIAVFGCAGERDVGRRKMGAIAARFSNFFIITAEDPRRESLEKINLEIAKHAKTQGAIEISQDQLKKYGIPLGGTTHFVRINDRQTAINIAIMLGRSGDVVGLFGKGHEKSMCFATIEKPWSEHQAVKNALKKYSKFK